MKEITNETAFENHIRHDILNNIICENQNYKLFNFKKAVDVLIAKNGANPELYFLEIKYHKKIMEDLVLVKLKEKDFSQNY